MQRRRLRELNVSNSEDATPDLPPPPLDIDSE